MLAVAGGGERTQPVTAMPLWMLKGRRVGLRFPKVADVPLKHAPLAEVICQVRFPIILRIAKEVPSDFQEQVRHRFPMLQVEQNVRLSMAAPPVEPSAEAQIAPPLYRFRTADGTSSITLAPDSYTLTVTQYTVWEDFARDLDLMHEAAMLMYGIPFSTRIGLRYVNFFRKANTGRETLVELGALLRPEFSCLLSNEPWSEPEELLIQLLLNADPGKLAMRFGAKTGPDGEPLLFLDLDFFEEGQVPLAGLVERCKGYHDTIYHAFRWSVRDDALDVFESAQGG